MNSFKKTILGIPVVVLWHIVIRVTVQGQECSCSHSQGNCPSDTCSTYQWIPEDQHPCTVERISFHEYQQRFGPRGLPPLFPTPIVIAHDDDDNNNNNSKQYSRNHAFRQLTRFETILDFFTPGFNITLSSSNSFSEHRKTMPLEQYLQSLATQDTLPHQLSNETWYFFGETYSAEWKQLLLQYDIPHCQACQRDMVALSFGIGNRGSGVQWHVHGPGFAETIWGRKHWILSPPTTTTPPDFHPDQTSRNWMEFTYPTLPVEKRPLECTLEPGDILYFPDMWYHATINLDPYTAFVSTFTQEHLFVQSSQKNEK